MSKKPVVLIIRDGWGDNPGGEATAQKDGNAVLLANTPVHDRLLSNYPQGRLSASGMDVGLPAGQMGNSEVGHLNLGAGRVVYQGLTKINKAIADDVLKDNPALIEAMNKAQGKRLHLLGLVSDGGVHSHQDHLVEICKIAKAAGVDDIMIHAITDGRDTSPTGGEGYLLKLQNELDACGVGADKIATVVGRYHAMDRDKRWERNQLAWDAIVSGVGAPSDLSPAEAVAKKYTEDETDEFINPLIFSHHQEQRINDGDVVFFYNFRADRARQVSDAFLQGARFSSFDTAPSPQVEFITMTQYDENYECGVLFPPEVIPNTLGTVVSKAGLTQLRAAETEKYPHVTYFFNGGDETPNEGEDRHMVSSPKVATYDLQPEMSAIELTADLIEKIPNYDLVIINFANPDMVGHTGSVEAACKSVETIDNSVGQVVDLVLELGGKVLITADHGNCEEMIKPDGSPHTAHTTYPVSTIYVGADSDGLALQDGILGDVSPTLLAMLGVAQPVEMTGKSLLVAK